MKFLFLLIVYCAGFATAVYCLAPTPESGDGKPVQLFFLILTPASASGAHLKLLGQLARVLRSRELREDLRSAATCQQFCQILRLACGQSPEHGS